MATLDETADLFYDADEPSRFMAGCAVWPHDYLKGVVADELCGPDVERLSYAMLGITEASCEYLSGAAADVYVETTLSRERMRRAWPSVFWAQSASSS